MIRLNNIRASQFVQEERQEKDHHFDLAFVEQDRDVGVEELEVVDWGPRRSSKEVQELEIC